MTEETLDEFTRVRLGRMGKDVAELLSHARNTDARLSSLENMMALSNQNHSHHLQAYAVTQKRLDDIDGTLRTMDRRFDVLEAMLSDIHKTLIPPRT